MASGYCTLWQHRSRGLFSGEDKTEAPRTRDAKQSMGIAWHTHRRTVSAHTLNTEDLDAATCFLFSTWLQKCWQPVPDPPGKRMKYSFLRNVTIHENKPKDADIGCSTINGPLKSLFCAVKVPVQSLQAPCTCSTFPSCLIKDRQPRQTNVWGKPLKQR